MAIKRYGQNLKPDLSLNKVETYDFTDDEMFGFEQDEEMKVAVASEFADAAVARNTINNLTSTDTDKALSANQGKVLKDAQDVLNGDVATEGSVLKDIKDNAEDATFTDTSGLDSTTIANAINEIYAEKATANGIATLDATGKIPATQLPTTAMEYKGSWDASSGAYPTTPDAGDFWIVSAAGTTEGEEYDVGDAIIYNGATWDKINKIEIAEEVSLTSDLYTATDVKSALEEIAGSGRTIETVKGNADAIATLETTVDTNRLYSDSQYLDLKAKYEAQQIALNASKAELYTDDPILSYAPVEVIGKGYDSLDAPVDVSANVVDGSLSLEQKGLTITNLSQELQSFQTSGYANLRDPLYHLENGHYYYFGVSFQALEGDVISASGRIDFVTASFRPYIGASEPSQKINVVAQFTGVTGDYKVTLYGTNIDTGSGLLSQWDELRINDLTDLGLDHITDTAILAKMLPYVDGTKNVGKMGLKVIGKNLFDKTAKDTAKGFADGKTIISTGVEVVNTSRAVTEYIPLPTGKHIITTSIDGYGNLYDKNKNRILTWYLSNAQFVSASARYVRFTYLKSSIDEVQLEIGTARTAYEPYQEQLTFLPAIGNSLPNGTADSIKTVADGWEHTKRVGDAIVINGSSYSWGSVSESPTGWYWNSIGPFPNASLYKPDTLGSGFIVNIDGAFSVIASTITVPSYRAFRFVGVTFYFKIEKDTIDAEEGATLDDKWTNYLDSNPITAYLQLATPITTHYDLPLPTSGKTIHRFAGEEKIALYGTGLTFSENVLSVLSAIKFVAGEMTDITDLATITDDTVTFSGVGATDVVYAQVEHDVDRPLGVLEHTPTVSNTASRLASLEARVTALEV